MCIKGSFPKEEIGNTIDFLVSLSCDGTDLLVIFVKPGITNVTFRLLRLRFLYICSSWR